MAMRVWEGEKSKGLAVMVGIECFTYCESRLTFIGYFITKKL